MEMKKSPSSPRKTGTKGKSPSKSKEKRSSLQLSSPKKKTNLEVIKEEIKDLYGFTYKSTIGEGSYGRVLKVVDENGDMCAVKAYDVSITDYNISLQGSVLESYYGNLFKH